MKPVYEEALGVQLRVNEWGAAAVPDPDSEMAVGEFVALLVTVTLPW